MAAPFSFRPYAPSGAQGHVWAMPLVGVPLAALIGGAYGWLHANTPCVGYGPRLLFVWVVVRVLLLVGCAHGIGWAAGHAGRWLAVRDAAVLRLFGAAVGALAVWFAWVVHSWTLETLLAPAVASTLSAWLAAPAAVWAAIVHHGENGLHTLGLGLQGVVPTRFELWLPWAGEAITIVGLAARAAPWRLRSHGYCEPCHRWLRREPSIEFDGPTTARDVRRHGLAVVTTASRPLLDDDTWTRIRRQRCPDCAAGVFRVEQVLRLPQHGFASAVGLGHPLLHVVLAPLTARFEVEDGEIVVPWSMAGPDERRELDRIEALVHDAAPAAP